MRLFGAELRPNASFTLLGADDGTETGSAGSPAA
jgi:hypothetical protein